MNTNQTEHLAWIRREADQRLQEKFVQGDEEHGGPGVRSLAPTRLLDEAIGESIDMLVYLLTLRRALGKE